jgi:hypothetical protein
MFITFFLKFILLIVKKKNNLMKKKKINKITLGKGGDIFLKRKTQFLIKISNFFLFLYK